uniref:Uncharacterized protein n=1 Tax=Glossina pallidipes TaxID=7398 RepID=A0A1A9Z4M7_GLOPL
MWWGERTLTLSTLSDDWIQSCSMYRSSLQAKRFFLHIPAREEIFIPFLAMSFTDSLWNLLELTYLGAASATGSYLNVALTILIYRSMHRDRRIPFAVNGQIRILPLQIRGFQKL